MIWQFNPLAIPLFIGTIPLFAFVVVAWRERAKPAAWYFLTFALCAAGFMITYGLELLSASLPLIMSWLKLEYIFSLSIPVIWLLFIMAYLGYDRWLTRPNIALLFAVPAAHLALVWTNEYHGLNWATTGVEQVGTMVLFARTYGVGFWIGTFYLYGVVIAATILMIWSFSRSRHLYRGQIAPLILAVVVIWVTSVLTIAGLTPVPKLDLTPFGFALACLPLGWSLFRYKLIDLTPTAYSTIFRSMSDAVIVLDAQRRVMDMNPAAETLLNTSAREAVGRPAESIFSNTPDVVERYRNVYDTQGEFSFGEGEGRRWFDLRISPLHDRKGQRTGRIIVLREITRLKQAEETVRKYAAELEFANAELDAFNRTVAHDLRAPLSVIQGFADMALMFERDALSSEGLDYIQKIQIAASRMNQMIGDLLLLARLKDISENVKEVAMPPVVQAAVDRFRADIERRGVRLDIMPDLPPALGQPTWIEEVFANFISNAIKYIGRDNPAPHITIQGCQQDGFSRYEVVDNGVGITPENQTALFKMFTRFHENEASGTGLGLSIVLRIITRLNGKVGVESAPGAGSTFWFTLPVPHHPADQTRPAEQLLTD